MSPTLVDCPACRHSVSSAAPACPRCGHPVREDLVGGGVLRRSDGSGPAAASDTMALVSLICGVVSVGVFVVPDGISWVAIVPALLGIVLSLVALRRVVRGVASGRSMAVGGLVTGLLCLLLFAVGMFGLVLAAIKGGE